MRSILIVTPYFFPEGGGLELYAYKIARHLSKKDEVVVLCSTKKESKSEDLSPNLKVIRERPDFFVSNTPIKFGLKNSIESIVKEKGIHIINAYTPVPFYADIACLVAKRHNIPLILHYCSGSLYKNRPFLDLIAFFYENLFEKRLFAYAKKIILLSGYILNGKGSGHKDKAVVIAPSINKNMFKVTETQRKKEILFVAQLNKSHKWKGLEKLIKAFCLLDKKKGYRLIIIGSGDYMEYYKRLTKDLNLEDITEFLGYVKQEDLPQYYQRCGFVVIPSISNVEGPTTVIFESMACGKPLIAGEVGGLPYFIKANECGLLVNAENIKELSEAMNNLMDDKKLYERLSENGLANVHKYYEEVSFKKHNEIFEDVYKKWGLKK
ncbi:MAG: glycosyltransferase family 4 protein [Candidatus Omnitrophica bacterium]|nr:glycosyltransferase family 4 protein [Candidatus Omnitrophota bacterium]